MSEQSPFFSVVIPAYNAARFLGEAIESALTQTFQDFEVVVCDNASTDETSEVIRQYVGKVRTVRLEENRGAAGGRNAGVLAACGEYVAFLDADDLWTPDKLERCYQVIQKHHADFVFSNRVTIDASGLLGVPSVSPRKGQQVIPSKDPLLLLVNFIPCSSVVVRRHLIQEQPFDEEFALRTLEDHLLWLEINQERPLHYIDAPLLRYRVHSENASLVHRDPAYFRRFLEVIKEKDLYPSELMPMVRSIIRLRVAFQKRRRIELLRCLPGLLIAAYVRKRLVLQEWFSFSLRHLWAGGLRKWACWALQGQPQDFTRPTGSGGEPKGGEDRKNSGQPRIKNRAWKSYFQEEYPAFWLKRAPVYGVSRYQHILLEHLDPRPGERIFECGIGAGKPLAEAVAERGAEIHGLDISGTLLQECRRALQGREEVHLAVGDGEALPYKDHSFDKVYAISTTWYLLDLPRALTEMCRVLRPGGLLLFDVLNLLHIQALYGAGWRFLAGEILRRRSHPLISRGPWRIRRILNSLPLRYREEGFYPLLPPALPLVHFRLGEHIPFLAYGFRRSLFRVWGAKLVYICQREKV